MLSIPLPTLGWIILKAREFDVKQGASAGPEDDAGDNPLAVLEDRADDPTAEELQSWIDDLTDTQRAELVALFWLGRDDGEAEEFAELVETARIERSRSAARYLLGSPLLGDYLEEALERLGYDTSEIESRLDGA